MVAHACNYSISIGCRHVDCNGVFRPARVSPFQAEQSNIGTEVERDGEDRQATHVSLATVALVFCHHRRQQLSSSDLDRDARNVKKINSRFETNILKLRKITI